MKKLSKIFAVALVLAMVLSMMAVGAAAASNWTEVELSAVGANDMIAIVITKTGTNAGSYALLNENSGGDLVVFNTAEAATHAMLWNVSAVSGGYKFKALDENKYLYLDDTNDGVSIGSTGAVFSLKTYNISGTDYEYLTANDTASTPVLRTLCVYNAQDFRCYKLTNNLPGTNATKQNVKFYKWTGAKPGAATPTVGTIAQALAAAKDTLWTVTGVINHIDGNNVYIQDDTGAICLRLATYSNEIAVGDTITGTGKRDTYNGLPQLGSGIFEDATAMTPYAAKAATIAELTTADLCKLVKLENLTVTAISASDNSVTLSDGTNTITIYKAITPDGLAVDDVVNVTAAVSCYNSTLQLRNDKATDITVVPAGDDDDDTNNDDTNNDNTNNDTNNDTNTGDSDKTGDSTSLALMVAVMALSLFGMVAVVTNKKTV